MVAQVDPANPHAERTAGIFDQIAGDPDGAAEDTAVPPAVAVSEANESSAPAVPDSDAPSEDALAALAALGEPDASGELPTAPATPAPAAAETPWPETDHGKAYLSDYRRRLEEDILGDLDKGLTNPEARASLNARKRRFVTKHSRNATTEQAVTEGVATNPSDPLVRAWYAKHDALLALRADSYAWDSHLADVPGDEDVWDEMRLHKRSLGLPKTATATEIQARVAELSAQYLQTQARRLTSATDPDTLYDRFMERLEFAGFSEAQRAELLPDAFPDAGDEAARAFAMTERFGEFAAIAKATAIRNQKIHEAAGTNGAAQKAQAAARASAPVPAGTAVTAPLDETTLARQFAAAIASDTLTPELHAQMWALEERRRGGSGWV